MKRKELTKRFRKVAWGRLYWKANNPNMRRFDSDDICIVMAGVGAIHYQTIDAFIADIENQERIQQWKIDMAEKDYTFECLADKASL